jgi:Rod binding domain-containing protein
MEVSALNRHVSAAELPLEKLAGSKAVPQQEKIAEISRQFEAVLLRQILSQAQKPMLKDTSAAGSSGSKAIYQDMLNEQLADRISHGGSFGFAKVLEKQLTTEYVKKPAEDIHWTFHGKPVETVTANAHVQGQPGKRL